MWYIWYKNKLVSVCIGKDWYISGILFEEEDKGITLKLPGTNQYVFVPYCAIKYLKGGGSDV